MIGALVSGSRDLGSKPGWVKVLCKSVVVLGKSTIFRRYLSPVRSMNGY